MIRMLPPRRVLAALFGVAAPSAVAPPAVLGYSVGRRVAAGLLGVELPDRRQAAGLSVMMADTVVRTVNESTIGWDVITIPPRRRDNQWTRGPIALLALTITVFAVVAVILSALLPSPSPVVPLSASYGFPATQYSNGLVIARQWILKGQRGTELAERLIASNVTRAALNVQFKEPIPDAIGNVHSVRFGRAPPVTLDASRVFEWNISIPAGGEELFTYKAMVAPKGITNSRLQMMVRQFDAAAAQLRQPFLQVRLRSLRMTVSTVRVVAGRSDRITLTGVMSNGMKASDAVLAAVKWFVENPEVAKVNAFGKITGLSPGRTRVTASYRGISVSALVVVKGSANTGAAPGSSNGQGGQAPNSGGPTSTSTSRPPSSPGPSSLTPTPIH